MAADVNGLIFNRCAQSFCQLHSADIIAVEADGDKLLTPYAAVRSPRRTVECSTLATLRSTVSPAWCP